MSHQPLVEDAFLRARWQEEYESFKTSPEAKALLERLRSWAGREVLKETASEAAFIQRFFVETWGYALQGAAGDARAYTCRSQFTLHCRYHQFAGLQFRVASNVKALSKRLPVCQQAVYRPVADPRRIRFGTTGGGKPR